MANLPLEVIYCEIFPYLKTDAKARSVTSQGRVALGLPKNPSRTVVLRASRPMQNFGAACVGKKRDFSYARNIDITISQSQCRYSEKSPARLDWFLDALEARPPAQLDCLRIKIPDWVDDIIHYHNGPNRDKEECYVFPNEFGYVPTSECHKTGQSYLAHVWRIFERVISILVKRAATLEIVFTPSHYTCSCRPVFEPVPGTKYRQSDRTWTSLQMLSRLLETHKNVTVFCGIVLGYTVRSRILLSSASVRRIIMHAGNWWTHNTIMDHFNRFEKLDIVQIINPEISVTFRRTAPNEFDKTTVATTLPLFEKRNNGHSDYFVTVNTMANLYPVGTIQFEK